MNIVNNLLPASIFALLVNVFSSSVSEAKKPNIILIMADDMGYSDIGCYGGEIQTPNIDRLAKEGVRFTTFYNMAKCNPTRSSLLTGLYKGGNGAVHLAQITKMAGYSNIMSGKEHFDNWVPEYCKAVNVFDKSFYFWATTEYFLPPSGKFERPFYLNGKELDAEEIQYQKAPMYKTDFITDYALGWLDEALMEDNPFFLYLPFHVPHYPLQARPEDIEKYRNKFKVGWDSLRVERFKRMQKIGILPENANLSLPEGNLNKSRGPLVPTYTDYYPWESLSDDQKDSLDLEMAVYAAMIDRMDQNIGRVLEKLEENGVMENTIIMFLADNGACPFYQNNIPNVQPGPADSYWSLRATWANLCNTPYRQYKQAGHEGGSNSPFIAYWPGVIQPGTINTQPGHVVDLAPTFLDICKVDYPKENHGYSTLALDGSSLLPIFKGETRDEPEFFISGLNGFRMFRKGNQKIVQMNEDAWEYYDLKNDPAELENLADKFPEIVNDLLESYKNVMKKQN